MIIGKLALLEPPARSTPARSFARSCGRLVRTHAFRLAALYFLVFASSVLGVLLFVYWTSADFVERQTEATLDAEVTGLSEQYAQRGQSRRFDAVSGDRPGRAAAGRQSCRLAGGRAGPCGLAFLHLARGRPARPRPRHSVHHPRRIPPVGRP